jgi:hypothetical protein
MTHKITKIVQTCAECPYYSYYSGGASKCNMVDEVVIYRKEVAPFCPLPDYPSRTIAEMQTTIASLREPNKFGGALALLSHVATKLKLPLSANGSGITIPFKDMKKDREIYLGIDYIREVSMRPFEITFWWNDGTFKLSPDADPPLLREKADPNQDLWHHHNLKV